MKTPNQIRIHSAQISQHIVRAASFPGSAARQYRIQLRPSTGSDWQLLVTCTSRAEAMARIEELTYCGLQVRMIDQPCCPTAA
jgi:hypothetical protein